MTLDQLFTLFGKARSLTGHRHFVVIGSLSILALEDSGDLPDDMTMSSDIDAYTRDDPDRIFDLEEALGADSTFYASEGYYLDPVSPHLPTLPDGWQARMNCVERDDLCLWFLDPNDAAISKYARSQPRDVRWIRSGVMNGYISLPTVLSRLSATSFLDEDESRRTREQVASDRQWFEQIKKARGRSRRDSK